MTTILTKIEAVLNLEPLSFVYDKHNEPNIVYFYSYVCYKFWSKPIAHTVESGSDRPCLLKRKKYQILLFKATVDPMEAAVFIRSPDCSLCEKSKFACQFQKVGDVVLTQGNSKTSFYGS